MPRDKRVVEPEEITGQHRLRALLAGANVIPAPGPTVHFIGPDGPVEDRLGSTTMGGIHASGIPHLDKPRPPAGRILKYADEASREQDERQRK